MQLIKASMGLCATAASLCVGKVAHILYSDFKHRITAFDLVITVPFYLYVSILAHSPIIVEFLLPKPERIDLISLNRYNAHFYQLFDHFNSSFGFLFSGMTQSTWSHALLSLSLTAALQVTASKQYFEDSWSPILCNPPCLFANFV